MRYVLDAASMKNVDSYSINTLGIPSVVLMERAAITAITKSIIPFLSSPQGDDEASSR